MKCNQYLVRINASVNGCHFRTYYKQYGTAEYLCILSYKITLLILVDISTVILSFQFSDMHLYFKFCLIESLKNL
jgi:hypothetical protein